jgi:hypothetical protein
MRLSVCVCVCVCVCVMPSRPFGRPYLSCRCARGCLACDAYLRGDDWYEVFWIHSVSQVNRRRGRDKGAEHQLVVIEIVI